MGEKIFHKFFLFTSDLTDEFLHQQGKKSPHYFRNFWRPLGVLFLDMKKFEQQFLDFLKIICLQFFQLIFQLHYLYELYSRLHPLNFDPLKNSLKKIFFLPGSRKRLWLSWWEVLKLPWDGILEEIFFNLEKVYVRILYRRNLMIAWMEHISMVSIKMGPLARRASPWNILERRNNVRRYPNYSFQFMSDSFHCNQIVWGRPLFITLEYQYSPNLRTTTHSETFHSREQI